LVATPENPYDKPSNCTVRRGRLGNPSGPIKFCEEYCEYFDKCKELPEVDE
jgi:hypothetical protein